MDNFQNFMKRDASPVLILAELADCCYDTAYRVVLGDRDLSLKRVQLLMAKTNLQFEEVLAFVVYLRQTWAARKPDPTPTNPKEDPDNKSPKTPGVEGGA